MSYVAPRISLIPESVSNSYMDAVDLARFYTFEPDEWQIAVMKAMLGELENGQWAAPRFGLCVPRQNGKNACIEIRELFGAAVLGERVLHTAHEVKTAMLHFMKMKEYFEGNTELKKITKRISNTNGSEAIFLTNGGSIRFAARSKSSGRGFSIDCLVMDEAQELDDEKFSAMQYTVAAADNPQIILIGTPPSPTVNGEVFTRFREQALEGKDKRLAWLEWSAEKGCNIADVTAWNQANPALGIRLSVEKINDEFAGSSDETFARERLGMWSAGTTASVIDADIWASLASDALIKEPVAFAIDVSPNRDMASIAVAGYVGTNTHIQVVDNRKGTGWIVERIAELKEKWNPVAIVVDSGSPAASLLPDLRTARVRVMETNATEMAQACGNFYDAVMQDRLRHPDQPGLNVAVAAATRRPLRDAWGWQRKNADADLTPLVAVTLAMHGLSTKRKPVAKTEKRQGKVLVLA